MKKDKNIRLVKVKKLKHQQTRKYLKVEFVNMNDKEIRETLRIFTNIKNILKKYNEKEENREDYMRILKNKVIVLNNVYETEFIIKKLRKDIPNEYHENLNSVFVFFKMIRIDKEVPCSLDFFKMMMKC